MPTTASRLSSFFANRLRAALWIVVVAAAIALVVAVIVGLGGRHRTGPSIRRSLVGAYILRVSQIQLDMAAQVRAIDTAYKDFSRHPAAVSAHVSRYRRAERTLALLRSRLATVHPPIEARKLHTLLLQLADQNVRVAAAVTALAGYLPRFAALQAPLRPASVQLRVQTQSAHNAKAQARAFAAYSATTASIARQLQGLKAPTFFVAARDAEAAQLRRLSSLAAQTADALSRKRLAAAHTLVGELGQAEANSSPILRAQRAGAIAYNALVKRLRQIATQIETERRALEKRLPQ